MEYCRRLKTLARLRHSFQRVSPSEFRSAPILIEMYDDTEDGVGVWTEDDKTLTYRSKHRIPIAFELETGMSKGQFRFVSFPQVLLVSRCFCRPNDREFKVNVAIKYHDSPNPETIINFKGTCSPKHHIQGSQVFHILQKDSFKNVSLSCDDAYNLYLDIESKHSMVFRYKLLAESLKDAIFFVCYDGLFYEFQENGKHRISQPSSAGLLARQDSYRHQAIDYLCLCPINFESLVERRELKFDNYRYVSFFCDEGCVVVIVDLALCRCTLGGWINGVASTIDTYPLIGISDHQLSRMVPDITANRTCRIERASASLRSLLQNRPANPRITAVPLFARQGGFRFG